MNVVKVTNSELLISFTLIWYEYMNIRHNFNNLDTLFDKFDIFIDSIHEYIPYKRAALLRFEIV